MVKNANKFTSRGFLAGPARRANLYIISGPSGAGKGTLIAKALERFPELELSISCTTRLPRRGEVEGREYCFMSTEDFEEAIRQDAFLEWARVYGYYYGTPRQKVEESLAAGKSVILEIDVQGARQVRIRAPEAIGIFIQPPSIAELERRLRSRGSEDEEELKARLAIAEQEMAAAGEYDYVVTNDDLDTAFAELAAILERCESKR